MKKILVVTIISSILAFPGCFIYSFKGGSLSPEIKTVSIEPFSNQANQVVPALAPLLTEKLQDKFLKEMKLDLLPENGDVSFRGFVTDYKVQPINAKSNDQAASTRLTITVKVEFQNTKEPQYSYDQMFTSYIDFDASLDMSSIETELLDQLTDILIQDVFNKAVNNW